MTSPSPRPDATARAPEGLREALAELVQIGLSVARMVGQVADAEAALAVAASQAGVAADVPALAGSLAEAIEADRAAAAAGEARIAVVGRVEAIAGAFARVSRSVRLTVLLAERMDRGWARGRVADGRAAMVRRQVARGGGELIAREAEGERAERLREGLAERLERLECEDELGDRPAEQVIAAICRDLGLDPARMVVVAPVAGAVPMDVAPCGGAAWAVRPGRRPDG